jgi:DNA-binding MarR family transcriptional regulator
MVTKKPGTEAKSRSQPSLAQTAYVGLLSASDNARVAFEKLCAPYDITAQQYNVLRILRGAGTEGLPTLTIAERMIERTPGITRMIDRLEAKGLVTREARPHDRRCVHCQVTNKGMKLLKLLDGPVEVANEAAFRGLSAVELSQLIDLLRKMKEAGKQN